MITLLTTIVMLMGFGSIGPKPTASHPGAVSTKTSLPFNKASGRFWLLRYSGFEEDKLILGKYRFKDIITSKKESQMKVFDSLGTGYFKVPQPPACVHLTGNLFIDEAEISNIDYQEYLFYVKQDSSEEFFRSAHPQLRTYDLGGAEYFVSPQYRFFPVVGLTYDQAVAYCRWRSHFVTHLYNVKNKMKAKFNFRLPTEHEWELAACNGLDKSKYPHGVENNSRVSLKVNPRAAGFLAEKIQVYKSQNEIARDVRNMGVLTDVMFNVKRELPYFLKFGTPFYTYAFYRNDFGIYNMIGNAAEMVAEEGIAKGGSYRDEFSDTGISNRRTYGVPMDDLGFRCVCEVRPEQAAQFHQ